MTHIEQRIFNFFIENLSYCALNKQKGVSMYCTPDNDAHTLEIKDWIKNVLKRKCFYQNPELPKLIFYFFPDKTAVANLSGIFEDIKFDDFKHYFSLCFDRLISTNDENNFKLFSHINFFHLIGSLRYFLNEDKKSDMFNLLSSIINNPKSHSLIKYSSLQIMTQIDIEPENDPKGYQNYHLFEKEYKNQLKLLESNELFRKYISFYSMYYYDNQFNACQLINEKYLDRIIANDQINFTYLHLYIPQIASQLLRLDEKKYKAEKIRTDLLDVFQISNPDCIEKIVDLKEKINATYIF